MTKRKPYVKPKGDRVERDAYYTTDDLALAIVRNLECLGVNPKTILEPSVGGGSFARACREVWPGAKIVGVDVDHEAIGLRVVDIYHAVDFLEFQSQLKFDLVIGNPPYADNLHAKHADHAFPLLAPGGVLCFLLPYTFDNYTRKRAWFHDKHGSAVRKDTIHPRPKFHGNRTAPTEYAAFTWGNVPPGCEFIKFKPAFFEEK